MHKRRLSKALSKGCLTGLAGLAAVLGIPGGASSQDVSSTPIYNPYPPGILPSDLHSEIGRVQREMTGIFKEALGEWKALPPPTRAGNPPTLQYSGYASVEVLGKLMNFDLDISPAKNEGCGFCHMPYAGFSGPIPSVNLTMVAYPGTYHYRAGKRTAQRYTYSPDFPVLEYDTTQALFFGGNFWDARSTGYELQSADAEQAQHPPVDTQEMGFPDTACIAYRLSTAVYRPLFESDLGRRLRHQLAIQHRGDLRHPGRGGKVQRERYPNSTDRSGDRTKANNIYDHWGKSVSKYERSNRCEPFHVEIRRLPEGDVHLIAKRDGRLQPLQRQRQLQFVPSRRQIDHSQRRAKPTPAPRRNVTPLFTCFGYANEGLPLNPRVAFYYQTKPDSFGFTANPYGFGYRDLGLGTFLRSGFGSAPNPNSSWVQFAPTVDGQMQVSTARNVAMAPPQCPTTEAPGPYFQKEFFHNGYIKSLKQLVHFYNTRDVYPVQCHIRTLPDWNNRKGQLLADARGPEQHRHDHRQPRLDGSGGKPDCRLPANADRWFHNAISGQ